MKFGIFTIVPYHEDFTQQQALNDALEQIRAKPCFGQAAIACITRSAPIPRVGTVPCLARQLPRLSRKAG